MSQKLLALSLHARRECHQSQQFVKQLRASADPRDSSAQRGHDHSFKTSSRVLRNNRQTWFEIIQSKKFNIALYVGYWILVLRNSGHSGQNCKLSSSSDTRVLRVHAVDVNAVITCTELQLGYMSSALMACLSHAAMNRYSYRCVPPCCFCCASCGIHRNSVVAGSMSSYAPSPPPLPVPTPPPRSTRRPGKQDNGFTGCRGCK